MSEKNVIKVVIDGKTFRLGGFESKEYLEHVAFYLNNKIAEMQDMRGYSRQKPEMKSILLSLNIADDYFKARARADQLEQDLESKDEESYAAKQDLVAAQVQIQKLERELETERSRNLTGTASGHEKRAEGGETYLEKPLDKTDHSETGTASTQDHQAGTSSVRHGSRPAAASEPERGAAVGVPVIPEMSTAERLAMLAAERSEASQQKGKTQIDRKKEELFGNTKKNERSHSAGRTRA